MSRVQIAPDDAAERFDQLYRDVYRSMVFLATATTQSTAAAEEIVQDAFVQLYRNWDRVEQPRAWLRRAVLSLCTSWVRTTVRARAATAATPLPELAPDRDVDGALDVWTALSRLPARQRAAVVLRYVEDLPEREIAAALGCRAGTVKSALSRARETLREELTDAGH